MSDPAALMIKAMAIAHDIDYKPGFRLKTEMDPDGRVSWEVTCERLDAVAGGRGVGRGGKRYLDPGMNIQQLVQQGFGMFKAYEEHECREFFKYRGKRIFGPHITLEALMEVADRTTY